MQFQSSDFELFYLVAGLIGLVLAIVWAVFPFLVISRLNQMVSRLDNIDQKLFVIATNSNDEAAARQGDRG